ncbi:MAG: integrase core domain-containing protein [Actinomycetota bacterium]|nr:integrase core domain-containing protein [Actinomycetota bacterium]
MDHHPGLRRGELGPGRGRVHRRPGRRGPPRRRRRPGHRRAARRPRRRRPRPGGVPDRRRAGAAAVGHLRQRSADALSQHAGVPGRGGHRPTVRPPTHSNDHAWIESLFGHLKTDWPHLEKITDPGRLTAELDRVRHDYNTVRLHAGIGYLTPDDEYTGRGDGIRAARRHGLAHAREARITYHRTTTEDQR